MPLAALAEVLEDEPTISMSRDTPARVVMHNGYLSMFTVGGEKFVVQIWKTLDRRVVIA